MTTTAPPKPPARPGPVQRYGPLTAILVFIALIGVLVTVSGRDDADQATGVGTGGDRGGSAGAPPASAMPITYEQAKKDGREQSVTWVDNCDPATGRIKIPTIYAMPCVPKFTGANGGATAPGVTADTITIVYYVAAQSADVLNQVAGNIDTPDASRETVMKFAEMLGAVTETYGRKLDLKIFQSTAAATDVISARADAQKVIDEFHPFASIGGPTLTTSYAEELAAQGVICVGCGGSAPDQAFQDAAPHLWGATMSPEQWLTTVSDYIGKRLAKRPARWAGDAALKSQTRKFGVVNFEYDPPVYNNMTDVGQKCEALTGWKRSVQEKYLFTNAAERAQGIISKLKAEGITTVVFMGDPITPRTFTAEATRQGYFPEWIVTGTAFTDLAAFARSYDQAQWKHAFGLSQLAVTIPRDQMDGWKLHQWYFGTPPAAQKTAPVLWYGITQLMNGIHMAGPNLNATTFGQGLFNLPPTGGGPTAPRISYGEKQTFPRVNAETCAADGYSTDYLGTDDMVEIWWDPEVTGPDEQGTMGKGKYRYANEGRRYLPGQLPETEADAFRAEKALLELTTRPASDRAPDYPRPAR